ncbi:carbohydrate ABC transporter permease [Paenibacillus sp. J5C_2022]|uniref:carbohydrate ABC transporter permease n=1 Tax=Paenibacillus sp. J5C2022 TaxID=2977129 RepID=UPI0021D02E1A|nr:carbohydrate ABC transporter permease [Paenibacillus sp. J5C2022]MCU6708884.1 carbohydrate ABC transporter permease [Paenibacillus sp. J5C2022]
MVKARFTTFDVVVYAILLTVGLLTLLPFMYVISVSLTPYSEVVRNGGFVLIPHEFTMDAYRQLFDRPIIPRAFGVTLFLSIAGTAMNLALTLLMAYPLSRKKLPGRTSLLLFVVFTMLFNGGLIPTYLIVKETYLLNTIWAMIIPSLIWAFNILVMKTFLEGLPEELFESARMDGAGEGVILLRLVMPLSIPSLVTIGLFYLVGHWNQFFLGVLYIQNTDLFPLQLVVRNMLISASSVETNVDVTLPTATLQMAAVVTASLPIVLVYPFFQKHLTKGMLLGSIKG